MAWPSKQIESWEEFLAIEPAKLPRKTGKPNYVFRGQAVASWHLDPSLIRLFKEMNADLTPEQAEEIEIVLLDEFRSIAPSSFPEDVVSMLDDPAKRWSVMQHYSAPTRMLDWTNNLFVAAYFAVREHWKSDGAIWVLRAGYIDEVVRKKFKGAKITYTQLRSGLAEPMVQLWGYDGLHERQVVQEGLHTFCHEIFGNQEVLIEEICKPKLKERPQNEVVFCKLVIPHNLKPIFLSELRTNQMTAAALFPGEDGCGESLSEMARLMAYRSSGHRSKPAKA